MRRILLALLGAAAVWPIGQALSSSATPTAREHESSYIARYAGLEPNTNYIVHYYVFHYEGDLAPYDLGVGVRSNEYGMVKAMPGMYELGGFYDTDEYPDGGPVYEVATCIQTPLNFDNGTGGDILACSPAQYVGYVPEQLWTYDEAAEEHAE